MIEDDGLNHHTGLKIFGWIIFILFIGVCFIFTFKNHEQSKSNVLQRDADQNQTSQYQSKIKHETIPNIEHQYSYQEPNVNKAISASHNQLASIFNQIYSGHANSNTDKNKIIKILGHSLGGQILSDAHADNASKVNDLHIGYGKLSLSNGSLPIDVVVDFKSGKNNYASIYTMNYQYKASQGSQYTSGIYDNKVNEAKHL